MEAEHALKLYVQAKSIRSPYENDMRMAAAYCMPWDYNAWQSDGPAQTQGMSGARRISYDTTGVRSLPKYVSVLERIATPTGQKWHRLMPSIPELRKYQRVRNYFDELDNLLFKERYNPHAGFRIASNEVYASLGTYGNGPQFIGRREPRTSNQQYGLKYVACPFRDVFVLTDDVGDIVMVFRRFWLNARTYVLKFGKENPPKPIATELEKPVPSETAFFEFVHFVSYRPKAEYDPTAIDARRHPVVGRYICVDSKEYVGEETGYQSLPYKMPRITTVAGNPYGYSPAITALASLGSASTMKKTQLKQGNLAVAPVLLAHDDGVLNGEVDMRPAAVNYGGINSQGKRLIDVLPTGNFQVSELLLESERRDIEDSFFVTLFQILTETPEMTATEVMERAAEKAALLSPTMGRLQTEYQGPSIERELDVLAELGKLPPMPPELEEAQGEYEIVYTSPMAKAMYAEEVSGFMRAMEFAIAMDNAKGEPSATDWFDIDTALPEISDYMAVPSRWLLNSEKVRWLREQRNERAQQAAIMQNAAGLAAAGKVAVEAEQQAR